MKKILIAFACLAILFSCKKNEQYISKLISSNNQVTTYPRLFTKFGEITNRAEIEKFVNTSTDDYFYLGTNSIITTPPDTITYKGGDTVEFTLNTRWKTRITSRSGEYIYFYMTDTLLGFKTLPNTLDEIATKIAIFKPYLKDACSTPGPPDGCGLQEVYDAYIATGSRERLEFPLLTFQLTRSINQYHRGIARKNYNNIFDKSVLKLLQTGDTLIIQTSKRIYLN